MVEPADSAIVPESVEPAVKGKVDLSGAALPVAVETAEEATGTVGDAESGAALNSNGDTAFATAATTAADPVLPSVASPAKLPPSMPTTPAKVEVSSPSSAAVPASPALAVAAESKPAGSEVPAPTVSVKELMRQLSNASGGGLDAAAPSSGSGPVPKRSLGGQGKLSTAGRSTGGGAAPALPRITSPPGVGAQAAAKPVPDRSAVRSEHDAKNTINVAQLLQQGEFKLQPGRDVVAYAELVRLRLEDGIDPTRKEEYLSDEEFSTVMGMARDAFQKLPAWRKADLKKKVALF